MSQVDIAGSIPALRLARGRIATVAVNSFAFKQPVMIGDVVSFYAEIVRVGRTSITVDVEVYARTAHTSGSSESNGSDFDIRGGGRQTASAARQSGIKLSQAWYFQRYFLNEEEQMHQHFRRNLMALAIAAALGGASGLASAAGFALIEQSGSGMGNAYAGAAATAEDASTIFFNPAGMTLSAGTAGLPSPAT